MELLSSSVKTPSLVRKRTVLCLISVATFTNRIKLVAKLFASGVEFQNKKYHDVGRTRSRMRSVLAGTVVLTAFTPSRAALSTYDDNVRATYTKQTYSTAGDIVDVTFKGFSQYGTKVRFAFVLSTLARSPTLM